MESGLHRHVYGPVPSRRLGRSVGIDLVPFKNCTYDCSYCQLGRTTNLTVERREYVPIEKVLIELDELLGRKRVVDCITLAGSGEPTLNSGVGRLIKELKRRYDLPVAVITNGALLWMPALREEIAAADYVLPSLDAGDQAMFEIVNRPNPAIGYDKMVSGLVDFARGYEGALWLEVMLLKGINAAEGEVKKIAARVSDIGPDRVQLNTVYRPPCEPSALPLEEAELKRAATAFSCPVDIVDSYRGKNDFVQQDGVETDVLEMLGRRPCTLEDISSGLSLNRLEVIKIIDAFLGRGAIRRLKNDKRVYYAVPGPTES